MKVIVDFGNDGFKVDAEVCIEGNKWCCFAGDFALMPAGFGNTVQSAICDFKLNVRNDRPPKSKENSMKNVTGNPFANIQVTEEGEAKTYRYEKVTNKGFFDLKDEFQGRMIFFNQSVTSAPDYVMAMDIIELSHHYMQKNLYRRIEVTERDEFIEEMARFAQPSVLGKMYDAGCRFVNGKG